jgi:hypothetical protein
MVVANPRQSVLSYGVTETAAIVTGIETIAGVLNKPRSVVLIIDNHTKVKLTRIYSFHKNGGWEVPPASILPARTTQIYGAANKANAIGPATEGHVIYELAGGDERIACLFYWNNPFVGSNKCSAQLYTIVADSPVAGYQPILFPYLEDAYKVTSTCGVGDQDAQMRFELLPGS